MKKILLTIFTFLLVKLAFSLPITQQRAEDAAKAYFKAFVGITNPDVKLAYTKYSDSNVPVFYVYNLTPKGFVMIAADDAVIPILATSLEGNFVGDNMPANISWWLDGYKEQIQYVIENNLTASSEVADEWEKLFAQVTTKSTKAAGDYLCQTKWDQMGYYCTIYNDLTPSPGTSDNSTPTGCVATAMAQIMKYWNHPATGVGSCSYSSSSMGGTLSANFGATTYNWANMPNSLTCSSSNAQKNSSCNFNVSLRCCS